MKELVNTHADMRIGFNKVAGDYMLYVQEGNRLEYFGWFTTEGKAEKFLRMLEKWDENGGNDEDLSRLHKE